MSKINDILLRYNEVQFIYSPMDSTEDFLNWISGLRSIGYNSDVLSKVHGFNRTSEIKKYSKLISLYSQNAIGLIEQGISGPAEVSYLPLYYAIVNFSKIYIVLSALRSQLVQNRFHGAKYNPIIKLSHNLLNEEIEFKKSGVLPLFYKAITDLDLISLKKKVKLSEIYPFIPSISFEYTQAFNKESLIQNIRIKYDGNVSQKFYYLSGDIFDSNRKINNDLRCLKLLKGFKYNTSRPNYVTSNKVHANNFQEAILKLEKYVRRYLIYEVRPSIENTIQSVYTPISTSRLLLPEEIPIWIAFFHLSNIVRYNPEFLNKLKDSNAWPVLLILRRHTLLRFLNLFWSYFHKKEFIVLRDY